MRSPFRSVRWRFLVWPGLATVLASGLVWSAPNDQPPGEPPSVEAVSAPSDLPPDAVDLSDKVEITVVGKLRSASRSAHSIIFSVKNTSDDDLKGPLIVLVDKTGIDALELIQTDGKLSDDRPFVEIVSDRSELKAGKTLRSEKLSFKTEAALTLEQRNAFDLKLRVCRFDEQAALAAKADEADKIEGKSYGWKEVDRVSSIQEKWTIPLIQQGQGQVYGTAVGENDQGELVVKVYTERPNTDDLVPDTVGGVPVKITPIGQMFKAGPAFTDVIYPNGIPRKGNKGNEDDFKPVPDGGQAATPSDSANPLPVLVDPTLRFNRPVPIGVSIANVERLLDLPVEESICYSGTLGCRCVDALGTQYVLTNLHVGGALEFPLDDPFALIGGIGDRIVQPSTGDAANFCQVNSGDVIAHLADFEPIFLFEDPVLALIFSHLMDASISEAVPGAVGYLPPPADGYQTIQRDVVDRPYIGMGAQKYGRTTVYTSGSVTGLNAISLVGYTDTAVAGFTRQIEVANLTAFGQPFDQAGDSGSLIVEYSPGKKTDGRPLALLFAGGPRGFIDITIANPIGPILTRFGIQVDDGQGAPFQAGMSGTMGGAIGPSEGSPIIIIDDGGGGGEIAK